MYSIIVVVAVVTSFLAPIGLRLTIRKVEMSEEEKLRIAADDARGVLDPERARVLLATSGGPNALGSAQFARGLASRSSNPVEVIHIQRRSSWSERLLAVITLGHWRRNGAESERIQEQLRSSGLAPTFRAREDTDPVAAVIEETRKGYDFLVLGASMRGASLGGRVLEQVVGEAPCHLAIVKAAFGAGPFRRVVVPFVGGVFARIAVEVAVRFCEAQDARLTLAVSGERRPNAPPLPQAELDLPRPADEAELERISKVFLSTRFRPEILNLQEDHESDALLAELTSGRHDLVVIGAENRAVMHRLFFGYVNERIIDQHMVSVAIVVPSVSRLR
jgi:nucleotide-binding universal stress UspA family protein